MPTWATDAPVNVPIDAYTTLQKSFFAPTTASFRTRDTTSRVGRPLTVSLPDMDIVFNGTVDQIVIHADGSRDVHAVDMAEFTARNSADYAEALTAVWR